MTTIIDSLSAELTFNYGVEIDPNVVSTIPFDTPLYDYLEAGPGAPHRSLSQAAVYAKLTAADFTASGDGSFSAGGDPPGLSTTRSVSSVTKKSYGAQSGLKDIDIIASQMGVAPHSVSGLGGYRDDAEFLLNLLYVRTRQAIDWAIIRGDSSDDSNNFDGLEAKVVSDNDSHILDVEGEFTKAKLDELIIDMMIDGITPTAIACNPICLSDLVQAYTTDSGTNVSVNMNMGEGAQTLGYWVKDIVTPAGRLPIIPDRRFSVSGTAPTFTADIFVLTREHMGEPILYLDWQVMPSALDLARAIGYYTSSLFAVWSHLALVEKSDWWAQGRLTDCVISYAPTPSTPTA